MFWKLFLIASVFSVVSASEFNEESSSFELPADWANIRSNIDTSFSCVGRAYGYYADIYNDCQLYHVCNPRIENGETIYTHNPFICSLGTVFDQRSQTCVHQTSDFSCAESVQLYGETENRYADVVPVNEVVSNVVSNVVSTPIVNEVVNSPPVNENVVNQPANVEVVPESPIFSPIEKPSVPLNNVESVVVNETPVLSVVAPVVTESTNSEVRSTNVHHSVPLSSSVPLNNVPVVNEVPVVRSSNVHVPLVEHSEVVDVHPVGNIVTHYSPVLNRLSSQNHVALLQPSKGPTKQVNVAKTIPVVNVSKGKIVQPVKAVVSQQVVQAPVQPVKAVVSQQVVQAPVQPVKAVVSQQVVQAPVQPVKAVVSQQVVQAPVQPVKAVVSQQVVQAPVQPVKAVVSKQVVQAPVQPVKTIRAPRPIVTQQQVEVPRKAVLVRQEALRSHIPQHVYYGNQPTWQYHYLKLYPHLVHNNRISRHSVRYVY